MLKQKQSNLPEKVEEVKKAKELKKHKLYKVNTIVKEGAKSYENITKLMNIRANIEGKQKSIDAKIEELKETNKTPEITKQLEG